MCEVVSGMFSLGGLRGMDWQEKVTVQNCGRALVKPKTSLDGWAAQRSSNTGYSQPRHLPVPEPAIRTFHITVNSPLLQSASSK